MARAVCDTRQVLGIRSIVGGGPLSTDVALQLKGDVNAPGALFYYGTDASGTKGFHPLSLQATDLATLTAQINALSIRVSALESASAAAVADGVYIASADYSVGDGIVLVVADTAGITITLPDPNLGSQEGRLISVKNLSGGDIVVTATPDDIDTEPSWDLADTEAMTLRCTGAIWAVV